MQREMISVCVTQNKEEVARKMQKFDFLAMPVVDTENRLVGIVTHDDVIDIVVQEATDDALKMGGVGSMAENYMKVPLVTMWRNRAGWLACLFVAELFTFTALAQFEHEMQAIVALSLFIPLCLSTAAIPAPGRHAHHSGHGLGYVRLPDWWRVLRHELILGLMLGVTLGILGFVRASLTPQSVLGNANRWMLALVIAQAVMLICIWGTLVGSMLPLVFRRLGFDPAYASSPFVATFVDVTGIVIYFSIASVFLCSYFQAHGATSSTCPRPDRWQFSLRTLLLLAVPIAVALAVSRLARASELWIALGESLGYFGGFGISAH